MGEGAGGVRANLLAAEWSEWQSTPTAMGAGLLSEPQINQITQITQMLEVWG